MTLSEYTIKVKNSLGEPDDPEAFWGDQFDRDLENMFRAGFSVLDACQWLRCTEEFNSELEEEVALRRMAKIDKKYENRRFDKSLPHRCYRAQ